MWESSILWTDFFHLFYFFIIYSLLGWLMETCIVSVNSKKFVNRGFINGPFCPIYGVGASSVYLFLTPFQSNIILVFVGGVALATIIEYFTAAIMEKLFRAKWWDYSDKKFNIKGRVCLSISLYWGLLSIIMLNVFQPIVINIVDNIPFKFGEVFGYVILFYFLADTSITVYHILKLNGKLEAMSTFKYELKSKIEDSHLFEAKEEIKIRIEQISGNELKEEARLKIASFIEECVDKSPYKKERFDEFKTDIKNFIDLYYKKLDTISIIERRLLSAFPNIKSTKNELSLKLLKQYHKTKKEKRMSEKRNKAEKR